MEQLIKLVAEKTGITTEQATTAVNTVMGFLKDKMPEGIKGQMESMLSGGASMGNIADGVKDKLGSMFGK